MKPFKNCIALALLAPLFFFGQNKKAEATFKKQCTEIVTAFSKQNFKILNKHIYKGRGVYIITRPGAIDALTRYDSLDAKAFYFYPYKDPKGVKKYPLKYGASPKFDCGTEKWDKSGFIADSAKRYNRLSELMDFLSKNEMWQLDKAEYTLIKAQELQSRKVVFTELAKKHGVVFHLSLINKKWYITLIDMVASDCGA